MPAYGVNDTFFSALNKEIGQVFDDMGFSTTQPGRNPAPRMSVSETENFVEIEAELPGVEANDVDVELNDDVLTIKGEKKLNYNGQQKDYYYQERAVGKFARSITLPFEPDPKTVKTAFAKGVLTITLPKAAGVKHQTVKIPLH
ncbi:MAG TPA: Hsp20/alpha crystallin family protein [Rhizomicrobium sp.]|nr:Hsp20/alpha crystallin family protein [Rhizomicrobium sp.]